MDLYIKSPFFFKSSSYKAVYIRTHGFVYKKSVFFQIIKLQGCVSLPKESTYLQKPTYASLANFSKGEFKSPQRGFSVTKPT